MPECPVAAICVGDWGMSAESASVESGIWRENRGAEGAEGVECGDWCPLPHALGGSGKEAVPPTQKMFRFLSSKGEFWCIMGATFVVELNGNWLGH